MQRLTYFHIPAADVERSARFYEAVLGWQRGEGPRFGDEAASLIGRFVDGQALVPYFTVDDVAAAVARVVDLCGAIVQAPYTEGDTTVARLRDPAGTVIGIWQFTKPRRGPPAGWHSVTARIVADDVRGLVAFIKATFAATGELQRERPTVLRIGDANIMISKSGPRPTTSAFLYVYVDDADAVYRRALEHGATSLEAPANLPYGDRRAMVEDRWHNVWQIATPLDA